jgi:hypothetical protein
MVEALCLTAQIAALMATIWKLAAVVTGIPGGLSAIPAFTTIAAALLDLVCFFHRLPAQYDPLPGNDIPRAVNLMCCIESPSPGNLTKKPNMTEQRQCRPVRPSPWRVINIEADKLVRTMWRRL